MTSNRDTTRRVDELFPRAEDVRVSDPGPPTRFGGSLPGRDECRVCNREIQPPLEKYCSEYCREVAYSVQKLYTWDTVRERILDRDDHQCVACGATEDLHVDHVRPVSREGHPFDPANLQVLCADCNAEKGTGGVDHRDPERGVSPGGTSLNPRFNQWVLKVRTGPPRRPDDPEAAIYPTTVAEYICEGLDRQDPDTLRVIAEYAWLLAEYQDRVCDESGASTSTTNTSENHVRSWDTADGKKVIERWKECGKDDCQNCPHGPYKELRWRDDDGNVHSEYLGKTADPESEPPETTND